MRLFVAATVVAATMSLSPAVAAQDVPVTRLSQPAATSADGFSAVVGFRVLSDGRIIVADALEQRVAAVDLRHGTADDVGRQGGGPGEYGMPGRLFAGPGDTTYMLDMGNRRLLAITPAGRILSETIALRNPASDGPVPVFPRGVDAEGRIYFDLAGLVMPGTGSFVAEGRAPILRLDPAAARVDTVGFTHFPPSQEQVRPGEVRFSTGGAGGGGPFAPRDAWAVAPDGRVGIARAADYHVEWLTPGHRSVAGPIVPYRPVPVTDAEKNAWADRLPQTGMAVEIENGRRRTRRPPRPDVSRVEWPEYLPPFPSQGVLATRGGELWVERARSAGTMERTYDVFDARGHRVRQVVIANGGDVRWVDGNAVYVTREDADGLQWIERYDQAG